MKKEKETIVIPDLDALLEELDRCKFTSEIEEVLFEYYNEFASRRAVPKLTLYINETFNRGFTPDQIARRARTLGLIYE